MHDAPAALAKLEELVAHLRGPQGCPWDRAQDYDSMKAMLLEEAYELVDATNARDFAGLQAELGDLLFQVVFCARLAEEERRFELADVIEGLHAKLVRRHPHVFGNTRARTPEEALRSWQAAKQAEGGTTSALPSSLPATLEAHRLGVRAAEAGFDWAQVEDVFSKVEEEVGELRQARAQSSERGRVEEEVGDLLFAASQLARSIGSDPESCLRRANQKFQRRYQALECEIAARGRKVKECSASELDAVWNEIKAAERLPDSGH